MCISNKERGPRSWTGKTLLNKKSPNSFRSIIYKTLKSFDYIARKSEDLNAQLYVYFFVSVLIIARN